MHRDVFLLSFIWISIHNCPSEFFDIHFKEYFMYQLDTLVEEYHYFLLFVFMLFVMIHSSQILYAHMTIFTYIHQENSVTRIMLLTYEAPYPFNEDHV